MAHRLSTLAISCPISSKRSISPSSPQNFRFLNWPSSQMIQRNRKNTIKARGGGGKDNLDHLQRASKVRPQQPQKGNPQTAPIGLWDRFPTARTVQQMMDTMERMVEDPLAYTGRAWPTQVASESGGYSRGRTPWEIKEGKGEYKMRFDMPGMTKQDVKVWVEDTMLVVKAEKKINQKENGEEDGKEEEEWSAESYGKYRFRIALPDNIQFEKVKAEVKDGVLCINIPKATIASKILDINVE